MSAAPHISRSTAERWILGRWIHWIGLAVVGLLPGCSSPTGPGESQILPPAKSYLRTAGDDSHGRELQIAVRRFSPRAGRGQQIWLVGVSHIGEAAYYAKLQELLDTNTLVLFEGVGVKSAKTNSSSPLPRDAAPQRREALDKSLQGTLASSLGLVFQLTAIDYTRSHFRNSDLTRADLETLIAAPEAKAAIDQETGTASESGEAQEQFAMLMQAMDEGTWLNSITKVVFNIIQSSPQMRGLARLAMIEMLNGVGGDFEALAKVNPGMEGLLKVLVEARNARVMEDLGRLLRRKRSNQQIAIFYGAAHMKDFEERLARQFDYVAREERWLTAFGVDFKQSGIGTAERTMIRSLIQWQLDTLRSTE